MLDAAQECGYKKGQRASLFGRLPHLRLKIDRSRKSKYQARETANEAKRLKSLASLALASSCRKGSSIGAVLSRYAELQKCR